MDQDKLKDYLTTLIAVVFPLVAGQILLYQYQILGYVAQYGPIATAIVTGILAVISQKYSNKRNETEIVVNRPVDVITPEAEDEA